MTLQRYKEKRDFNITPEPAGHIAATNSDGLSFVIQKHAASHLHYDFRLELEGVLLSWAVPKGPSLDPADKRLAVHVEDHPIEYGTFEGTIPAKQYGAGTVLVWDRGTWTPKGEPTEAYKKGRLKFDLAGEKLQGGWNLVRTRGRKYVGSDKETWLLIKENDEFARQGSAAHVVETQPDSVISGRNLDDVASGGEPVAPSNNAEAGSVQTRTPKPRRSSATMKKPIKAKASAKASDKHAVVVDGIAISHPDKVLFPEANLTKRDLAEYYEKVGAWLVPHLLGRPLSLVRCPDGWQGQCFYQKHANPSVSDQVGRLQVPEGNGTATYMSADSSKAVIALLQWGVTEFHPWGSRSPKLDRPDRLILDLDPDDAVAWPEVVAAIKLVRTLLSELGLVSFLKTTGGKGVHIVVPIRPTMLWPEAKAFTKSIADLLVRTFPTRFVATASKARRKDKIFIDYLRNGVGATAIAPYSVRARANAPVSTPLGWAELSKDVRFDRFNVKTVPLRLAKLKQDPWASFLDVRQSITRSMLKQVS